MATDTFTTIPPAWRLVPNKALPALALAAFALASPVTAKAQSTAAEDLCRDPKVAADLIESFNHMKWEDERKVVDIERLVTLAYGNGKSCHGVWDLEDGRQIEGTLTLRLNVAGNPIIHWQEETLPTLPTISFARPTIAPTITNPPAPTFIVVPPSAQTSSSFYDGAHDRMTWETWFNGLAGEEHDGAYFWAAQRSLPVPANCTRLGGEGTLGCLEAKKLLDPTDVRRKTDPEYKAGWNIIHTN
jgi:hypothetical protein